MSPNSYVLHSTRTLTAEGLKEAWVVIEGEKILEVSSSPVTGLPITELGDAVLMPGLIDSHVHINEPGRTEWEGFETATKAAAAGGITTLVDMPLNSSPVTTNVEAMRKKLRAAGGKIAVNCGLYGGIVPGNTGDLLPLSGAGVLGIKAFLSHSGIDDFPNVTEADLRAGMPLIAQAGLPLLVHAELVSEHPEINAMDAAPRSHDAWLRSRPKSWENDAIDLLIRLCREYRCRTHIVHLSSSEAIPALEAAIKEGLPITVETCPHYLVFAAEDIEDGQTVFKCAPPIRERANNELLWEALRNGLITMVVTDHSPATPDLKGLGDGRFREAWGGIASLQYSLPATWTGAKQRGFSIEDVASWMSSNVARFLELDGSKGKIAAGYDADLVVWNPEATCNTAAESIHHRHPVSPYAGMNLQGQVLQTYVGGNLVFDHGAFLNLNSGKLL
ncbi:MAG: allantoinase AllB [Bacteroidia bacterium]